MTVAESKNEPRFHLKLIPILITAVLGFAVPNIAAYGAFYCSSFWWL